MTYQPPWLGNDADRPDPAWPRDPQRADMPPNRWDYPATWDTSTHQQQPPARGDNGWNSPVQSPPAAPQDDWAFRQDRRHPSERPRHDQEPDPQPPGHRQPADDRPSEHLNGWRPPARTDSWDPQPVDQQVALWAAVRNQVATKTKAINASHCHAAYEVFGQRGALSPLGLVFYYLADEPAQPGGFQLYAAARLNYSGKDYDRPDKLLPGITAVAQRNIANARRSNRLWDPRGPERSLVNSGEMDMPGNAVFIGTGLETLNSEHADWYTVAQSIMNQPASSLRPRTVFDIAGQGYIRLTDGTALHVRRDPALPLSDTGIRSTKTLNPYLTYQSTHSDLMERGDQQDQLIWRLLGELHDTLADYLTRSLA